jgi:type IV secretory pathway VirJ component
MQNKWIVIFFLLLFFRSTAQQSKNISDLPVMTYISSDTSKPIILYYTGDGGFNSFSTKFVQHFNTKGYPVISFNCLKHFWKSQTPGQSAVDASNLISYYENLWKRRKVILIGYSFGADIVPFIFTRLPKNQMENISQIILLSPSNHTDFEVHVTEMLGENSEGVDNVPAEINKINQKPILILSGEKEDDDLNIAALNISNYKKVTIPGGHHYDGNPSSVAETIIKYLRE